MNVLILSTYEKTGGAAIAANRLLHALNNNGVNATMLCRKHITWGPARLQKQSWASIWERLVIFMRNGFSLKNIWAVDIANCGEDVTSTQEFKDADVIHLHYVDQGFLSLDTIRRIVKSGKRIVWTMHDEWPLDSIYHYTYGTEDQQCSLAREVFRRKERIYSEGRITFVTCSEWLGRIAKAKPLGTNQEVVSVPNPIDSSVFRPQDKEAAQAKLSSSSLFREKGVKRVLFVSQNVNDERKGIRYLDEAARLLKEGNDGYVSSDEGGAPVSERIEIIALGRDIPYINNIEEMAALYASVDAFVTPSLQDNLPNTIMEAMACGTPCVGFNVGGIPEMIDHKVNGYVADYKDARDLAEGIRYVLAPENHARLSLAARKKVLDCYSEKAVAEKYLGVYRV